MYDIRHQCLNYQPQGKVIFSEASVSHSVHREGVCLQREGLHAGGLGRAPPGLPRGGGVCVPGSGI